MPKLSLVERGIRRAKAVEHKSVRLPITPAILRQLRALWSMNATWFDYIMLWAACCAAFFGFFGMGKITSSLVRSYDVSCQLTMDDVVIDDGQNPTVVRIHLKRMKTTPFSGVDVFLGGTDDDLCPVSALLAYWVVRRVALGPLFRFQDGRFLTKQMFMERMRMGLDTLGLSSSWAGGRVPPTTFT